MLVGIAVGVAVGVAVSLPDGVGESVAVGVGAGTRNNWPGCSSTVQAGPPESNWKSHCENAISGLICANTSAVVLYWYMMATMLSCDCTV